MNWERWGTERVCCWNAGSPPWCTPFDSWDTFKSQFLVNNAQGCTALGKCIEGWIRLACKKDRRKEGIWNRGRLAGAKAKPEREAEHVCPVEPGKIQSGTGSKVKGLDCKIHVCKAKENWNFTPIHFLSCPLPNSA